MTHLESTSLIVDSLYVCKLFEGDLTTKIKKARIFNLVWRLHGGGKAKILWEGKLGKGEK
jgi:hypothetical protein